MLLVSRNQVRDTLEELGDECRGQHVVSQAPLLMLCSLECQLWTGWCNTLTWCYKPKHPGYMAGGCGVTINSAVQQGEATGIQTGGDFCLWAWIQDCVPSVMLLSPRQFYGKVDSLWVVHGRSNKILRRFCNRHLLANFRTLR